MFFNSVVLLAGAGFAAAQSTSGLSSQCQRTLINTAASPEAACLNPSGLISLGLISNSSSIIPGVNTWLSGLCSQDACSNSTLQAVITNVTSGCSTDLSSLGLTTTDITAFISSAIAYYPTVRQVICLKDMSTSTLCVPELLTNIQSATTTLSLNNMVGRATKWMSGQSTGIPSSAICTDCTKAAYTILSQGIPQVAGTTQSALSSECGTNYTNGQMPSNVMKTATNSSTLSTNTGGAIALSYGSLNMGAIVVAAISAAFAILA